MIELPRDSLDYDVLARAVARTRDIDGLSCEIGVREGGGSQIIIEGSCPGSTHVAVDPYGGIPYHYSESMVHSDQYPNSMRNRAIPALYAVADACDVNFLFFCMTDTQFFCRFASGISLYDVHGGRLVDRYRLVHVDGQHCLDAALGAARFFGFHPRMAIGGEIAFDDIHAYDHGFVDMCLFHWGFSVVEKTGNRAVYRREH